MSKKRPTTIAEYIDAAPSAGQPHLHQIYAILKSVAPKAEEAIKWGNPFFVEPRFLFAFSAHKTHVGFAPMQSALDHFRDGLDAKLTTKHTLKIPYDQPVPEAIVRKIAKYCVKALRERKDDSFW